MAIYVLDRIALRPGRLREYREFLERSYLPGARARGLELVGLFATPPLELEDASNELLALWSLPDLAAFWRMRLRAAADPGVERFWRESEDFILSRERRFLCRLGEAARPVIRQLALLSLRKGAEPERVAAFEAAAAQAPRELPGLRASFLGRHLPGALRGGDYSWDALFDGAPGLARAGACPLPLAVLAPFFDPADARCVVESSDVVRFAPQHVGIGAPALASCVKRTLLLSVRPGSAPEAVERFERDLLAMPRHIPSIRNWALSRTDPVLQPTRWTHVWEQEYQDLDGFRVDYMSHPWHWGQVDGWFDPECPQRIAELEVANVFCAAPASILGWAA